ncbi:MAG: hypothetical protein MUE40_18830 [Anaerolineae bacterium]|nr:hypothetical protein [Anaerolineae bacterium]
MSITPARPLRRPLWLRLLLLLLLVALFLGVNALYAPAITWQGILSDEPGRLLYAAGFDGFTDEWQQSAGRDSHLIQEGHLQISVTTSNVIYSAARPIFADFDARVTLTAVGGSEENEGAGLIFRLEEQRNDCDMPLKTLCDLATIDLFGVPLRLLFRPADRAPQGYYVFLISTDGYYSLWRRDPAGFNKVTVWHNSHGLINTGLNVANEVRVVGRGDTFQFYINGQPVTLCVPRPGEQPTGSADNCLGERVTAWQDGAFTTGRLGVVVHTADQPGTVVNFDQFIVLSPSRGGAGPNPQA